MGLDSRQYIHGQGFHSYSQVSKERWEEIFGKYPKTMKRLAESEKAEGLTETAVAQDKSGNARAAQRDVYARKLSSKEKLGVKLGYKHCYCATKIIRNDGYCETCGGRVK